MPTQPPVRSLYLHALVAPGAEPTVPAGLAALPVALPVALLAALTVLAVAGAVTAARGHWRAVTPQSLVATSAIAGLAGLTAWVQLATWTDWGGYVGAVTTTALWSWPAYYTLDPLAPPGISQRITAVVRRGPVWAALLIALVLAALAHWLTGYP